jgi:hypothetical protein
MASVWLLRAGSSGRLGQGWKDRKIVSIGWDVGDLREEYWWKRDVKERIGNRYESDLGGAAGNIRWFADVRDQRTNLEAGDVVVILGHTPLLEIAEEGEYQCASEGLDEASTHSYWRDIDDWRSPPRRVPLGDLPARFRQGGEHSLHTPSTRRSWDATEEALEALVEAHKAAETIIEEDPVFEFQDEAHLQSALEGELSEIVPDVDEWEAEASNRAGRADFRCETTDEEVVIAETKIGIAGHRAVGQLLAYVNAERQDGRERVRGVLVAPRFSRKAKRAAVESDVRLERARPTVDLMTLET